MIGGAADRLRSFGQGLWAVLRQRCPRCRKGRMFRGLITMNDPCPVCGLLFQREEGYFLGALFISYPLSTIILVAFFVAFTALLPGWNVIPVSLLAAVAYLPFVPLVFRYSRVLWVNFDRFFGPSDFSASQYEKHRRRQTAGNAGRPSA